MLLKYNNFFVDLLKCTVYLSILSFKKSNVYILYYLLCVGFQITSLFGWNPILQFYSMFSIVPLHMWGNLLKKK